MGHEARAPRRFRLRRPTLGLRLAFLLVIAGVENALGWDRVVVQLACLSAALCLVLAAYNSERPTVPELNHWDEAGWFGLVACLG